MTEEQISDQMETAFRMRNGSSTGFVSTHYSGSNGPTDSPYTIVGLDTTGANSAPYFKVATQLSIITHNILTTLCAASPFRSTAENQQNMAQLGQSLDQWVLSLPRELNFQDPINGANTMYCRERMLLGYQLCSARISLGRPYLSTRRQAWRDGNEANFVRRMGNSCVEAAITVVGFLPDDFNVQFMYDQGPWWCIVHHLMQAVSVLLLDLSRPTSTSQDSMLRVQYIKKATRYLQVMQDSVAERAYQVVSSTFETVMRRHPVGVAGVWKPEFMYGGDATQTVGPGTAFYVPTQYVPQAAFSTVSNETAVFVDNYYVAR
jgi:hypothetical protein